MRCDLPLLIGKYRVLKKLGEARPARSSSCHDDFQDKDVAIKRVRSHGAGRCAWDNRFFERFFAAEAGSSAAQAPERGADLRRRADPVEPYLVMEYVSGKYCLRPYCRADQLLPLELIVELGFKVRAMALDYVYRQA